MIKWIDLRISLGMEFIYYVMILVYGRMIAPEFKYSVVAIGTPLDTFIIHYVIIYCVINGFIPWTFDKHSIKLMLIQITNLTNFQVLWRLNREWITTEMTNHGPNVVPVGFTVLYQNLCLSFYSLFIISFFGVGG